MKVPGTKVHREVAVEVTELGGLLKTHLKDGALDARTNDNTLPVMFKQVFDQGLHRLVCRFKVTQDSCRAIELFNRLLPQQCCVGNCGHGLFLMRRVVTCHRGAPLARRSLAWLRPSDYDARASPEGHARASLSAGVQALVKTHAHSPGTDTPRDARASVSQGAAPTPQGPEYSPSPPRGFQPVPPTRDFA